MRYSLRSLLVITALCAIVAARVGYFRHQAAAHRNSIARLLPGLSLSERCSAEQMNWTITELACEGAPLTSVRLPLPNSQQRLTLLGNGDITLCLQKAESEAPMREAVQHAQLVELYERAMLRPWTIVRETTAP